MPAALISVAGGLLAQAVLPAGFVAFGITAFQFGAAAGSAIGSSYMPSFGSGKSASTESKEFEGLSNVFA